jgi:hypothetical protein
MSIVRVNPLGSLAISLQGGGWLVQQSGDLEFLGTSSGGNNKIRIIAVTEEESGKETAHIVVSSSLFTIALELIIGLGHLCSTASVRSRRSLWCRKLSW